MAIRDVVTEYARKKAGKSPDWDQRRGRWIREVDKLYEQVTQWFGNMPDDPSIKIERDREPISDGALGDYEMDYLEIEIVDRSVIFEPVGAHIIGAQGRVDLYQLGYESEGYILLLFYDDETGEGRWEATSMKDKRSREPFNELVFERFLRQMLTYEEFPEADE